MSGCRKTPCFQAFVAPSSGVSHAVRQRGSTPPQAVRYGAPHRMPSASTHEVISFLDQLLEPDRYDDFGPNGLQVPGASDVATVVTGVSAHLELFERAAEAGADLVLVHHGLFWRGMPLEITPALHK